MSNNYLTAFEHMQCPVEQHAALKFSATARVSMAHCEVIVGRGRCQRAPQVLVVPCHAVYQRVEHLHARYAVCMSMLPLMHFCVFTATLGPLPLCTVAGHTVPLPSSQRANKQRFDAYISCAAGVYSGHNFPKKGPDYQIG